MTITKKILERARAGMEAIRATDRNCYVSLSPGNPHFIEWMVEKGSAYYCTQNDEGFVYWDGGVYGFTFYESLFTGEKE